MGSRGNSASSSSSSFEDFKSNVGVYAEELEINADVYDTVKAIMTQIKESGGISKDSDKDYEIEEIDETLMYSGEPFNYYYGDGNDKLATESEALRQVTAEYIYNKLVK